MSRNKPFSNHLLILSTINRCDVLKSLENDLLSNVIGVVHLIRQSLEPKDDSLLLITHATGNDLLLLTWQRRAKKFTSSHVHL